MMEERRASFLRGLLIETAGRPYHTVPVARPSSAGGLRLPALERPSNLERLAFSFSGLDVQDVPLAYDGIDHRHPAVLAAMRNQPRAGRPITSQLSIAGYSRPLPAAPSTAAPSSAAPSTAAALALAPATPAATLAATPASRPRALRQQRFGRQDLPPLRGHSMERPPCRRGKRQPAPLSGSSDAAGAFTPGTVCRFQKPFSRLRLPDDGGWMPHGASAGVAGPCCRATVYDPIGHRSTLYNSFDDVDGLHVQHLDGDEVCAR